MACVRLKLIGFSTAPLLAPAAAMSDDVPAKLKQRQLLLSGHCRAVKQPAVDYRHVESSRDQTPVPLLSSNRDLVLARQPVMEVYASHASVVRL